MSHIMIIDDDIAFAENITALLEEEGHVVNILDHAEGAVAEILQNKPDLLILDVMFPENPSAGFDLARKIRYTTEIKFLPIIMLTAVNQEFPMDFSVRDIDPDWMPIQDFVEKPVDIHDLVARIRELV